MTRTRLSRRENAVLPIFPMAWENDHRSVLSLATQLASSAMLRRGCFRHALDNALVRAAACGFSQLGHRCHASSCERKNAVSFSHSGGQTP